MDASRPPDPSDPGREAGRSAWREEAKAFEVQRRALRFAAEELEQALEGSPEQQQGGGASGPQGLDISRELENIRRAQDFMIEAWMD